MKELKCPKCGNVFSVDEADYAALLNQVKNSEFEAELTRRIHELEQAQQSRQQAEREAEKARQQAEQMRREQQFNQQLAQEQQKCRDLQSKLDQAALQQQVAVQDIRQQATKAFAAKEQEIATLRTQMETQLKAAQEQIDYYKEKKIRLSTKMIGESLEQHCFNEFLRISAQFPNAEFHKDNENVMGDDGKSTKGDFIFRDFSDDKVEYVSIMFEMKNENDDTEKKQTNQQFFHKLDEDRRKKNCEYAVLVTMLEPENELYNEGIVPATQNDKGERFDKMYVIRPQFFAPLITFLAQANSKTIEAKRALEQVRAQQIDVTDFEAKLKDYQSKFSKHVQDANARFGDALADIDKAIANLMDIREKLATSSKHLTSAEGNLEELTNIKKLTKGNKTMQALFAATDSQIEPPQIDQP